MQFIKHINQPNVLRALMNVLMNGGMHIASCIMLCVMLWASSVPAYAQEDSENQQAGRQGAITVEMKYDGAAVTGGTFASYQVGQMQEQDGSCFFVKTPAMETFSGSYSEIGSAALAERVALFVKEHSIPACATADNTEGRAVFNNLEPGLYLIVQTEASDGYELLNPFLVSLPVYEDDRYVYEVTAEGKCEPRPDNPKDPSRPDSPDHPDPSDPPLKPDIPNTGQLNWPIPILTVLGLGLFFAGWMLCFWGKRGGGEK